jgi:hypothetical protein
MLDPTKDVQGIAMYAQWKKSGNMLQVLVTPDGYGTESEKLVPATIYRRVTSTYQPKRQWRGSSVQSLTSGYWTDPENPMMEGNPYDPLTETDDREVQEKVAEARLAWYARMLDMIVTQDWEMVGEPLFVETSKKDIDDIRVDKTPSKLMYRVNQLREVRGFPMVPAE